MEKAGTGIKRVTNACVENGNKVHFDFSDSFRITVLSNKSNVVADDTDRVTDNQEMILQFIESNPLLSTSELANLVGISQRKIKENIAKLKEIGLLKRIGPAKGGHWQVTKK